MPAQDFAEAIQQLAAFPPGREALLQEPSVVDALQEVVDKGWTDEAKEHAAGALMALSDHQPDAERAVAPDQRHVMMSYQWDAQEIVQRIVNELQGRGYTLWFDLYQ